METAGEGGPWGMAILAAYMGQKTPGETLEDYLTNRVFANARSTCAYPNAEGTAGFQSYLERYIACLPAQKQAAALK